MAQEVIGGGKSTTTTNQVLGMEELINSENLTATMGNDSPGTPANADNTMAMTTDELYHRLFDDMSVNRGR